MSTKVPIKRTIQTALVDTGTIYKNQVVSVSSFVYHLAALLTAVHPCMPDEMICKGVSLNSTCWLTALSSVTTPPATTSLENTKLVRETFK